MDKVMKIRMFLNKNNKSCYLQVPKKKFDKDIREKIKKSKYAFLRFEGFE